MLNIQSATEKDLANMIDLWAEVHEWKFNPAYMTYDYYPPKVSEVLELCEVWKKQMEEGRLLTAYEGDILVGLCSFDTIHDVRGRGRTLVIEEFYISPFYYERSEKGKTLIPIILMIVGRKARVLGYQNMRIGVDSRRKDDLKDQCVRMGARYDCRVGMRYFFEDEYVWEDLGQFWMR